MWACGIQYSRIYSKFTLQLGQVFSAVGLLDVIYETVLFFFLAGGGGMVVVFKLLDFFSLS